MALITQVTFFRITAISNKVPVIATVLLDMNIGLRQKIKLKFMFQDYSPLDISRITLSKLLRVL